MSSLEKYQLKWYSVTHNWGEWLILASDAARSARWTVCNTPSTWSIMLFTEGLVYVGCWGFASCALTVWEETSVTALRNTSKGITPPLLTSQLSSTEGLWDECPLAGRWCQWTIPGVCVWELFNHLCDSPLVLSLDCCIHAHFLYVTILRISHKSETTIEFPALPLTCPQRHHAVCDLSHKALFQVLGLDAAVFLSILL